MLGLRTAFRAVPAIRTAFKAPFQPVRTLVDTSKIRNCAVIAHVDHGKTTLVDQLLKQSGVVLDSNRVMDSISLEKERGITIMSKNTSVLWEGNRLNIVDTPGHADFGGEVERVLSMVDGVLLVVDATEGPMTQTKFVLSKALQHNLLPIVVINKVDRDTARQDGSVEDDLCELFMELDANDEQLDFPILYASAKNGWCVANPDDERKDLKPLFEAILNRIPPPQVLEDDRFRMLVTNMEYDLHLGRLVTGKIQAGEVKIGSSVKSLTLDGDLHVEDAKITKIFRRYGMKRESIDNAHAGDIITLAGIHANVTDTVCDKTVTEHIPATPIDPPTLSLTFSVNNSPLQGKSGNKLTSGVIKDRLYKEVENNVTMRVNARGDLTEVQGRGELQLGILVEQMRREGFELTISSPNVLNKEVDGKVHEPWEDLIIDVPNEFAGYVIENLQLRGADMTNMEQNNTHTRFEFSAPARLLMGFRSEAKITTGGEATVNGIFSGYQPAGDQANKVAKGQSGKGKMYATGDGKATAYAIVGLEERGEFFVKPGDDVYKGMLVGETNKKDDMAVNVTKAKKITNMRSTGADDSLKTIPPRQMTLEDCISYVACNPGLKIEVTPEAIRIRKAVL